ncbi:DUF6485 family protein [Collinsella sp. An2]|uniref:DUF6485 family protein n=1 Tax=Collinsella sp. An2 TaxID=1965585 RepID=UPI000B3924E4|nr:DUF6485 family protein [Collinsella sp. An2]OUP08442.1 hypothetical protein B5F33_06995 [Collinsella sp. An2]
MATAPFCTCTDHDCPFNPVNHDKGCTLCVAKCLKEHEIPTCFFRDVSEADLLPGDEQDWTYQGFAAHVLKER